MDRINGADTIDIGAGRRGFIDEDLGVGQVGTEVTALWLNMTQEEIIKVIEVSGLVLNPADWTQLWQALQILGLSAAARSRRWTSVISMTLSSAPGAPAAGDTYLVPTGATGIWAAQVGKIAEWNGTAWAYFTPSDGHGIGLPDGSIFIRIGGVYTNLAATQAQVDAGAISNRFVTPQTLAKEKASYMSAASGSQSIPSGVWTTLSSYATAPTNFRGASTFASGVLTIGEGDQGLWLLTLSCREDNLSTTGQATRITVNNVAVASDGGQTSGDGATGHSGSATALPLAVGDQVRFQVIQTTGSAKTFNEYNLSAARLGNS